MTSTFSGKRCSDIIQEVKMLRITENVVQWRFPLLWKIIHAHNASRQTYARHVLWYFFNYKSWKRIWAIASRNKFYPFLYSHCCKLACVLVVHVAAVDAQHQEKPSYYKPEWNSHRKPFKYREMTSLAFGTSAVHWQQGVKSCTTILYMNQGILNIEIYNHMT